MAQRPREQRFACQERTPHTCTPHTTHVHTLHTHIAHYTHAHYTRTHHTLHMYTHTTRCTRTCSAAVFTLTRGGHGPPPGVRPLETAAFRALRTPLPPALLSSWFLRPRAR